MAKTVKVLSRTTKNKGGFDSNGVAKQDKVEVSGIINVSSYTANGEPLSAADVGLATIDTIHFDVESVNNAGTVPVATAIPLAAYDRTGARVIIVSDHGTDTPVVTGEAAVVRFVATGDSAHVAELT